MKTYTKRILTWLMVIAMLTGIILTDYRAPVFSRAEEATVTQANTDGTSASSSTEAGEQTEPQAEGAQEQTSPDATTQGAETQAGEQGAANAPANLMNSGPDITGFVDVSLQDFYVKNGENKQYIIKGGQKQTDNLPQLKVRDRVYIKYDWGVKEENINYIGKDKYFQIELPGEYFRSAFAETSLLKITKGQESIDFAECKIVNENSKVYLRALLNQDEKNYNEITNAIENGWLEVSLILDKKTEHEGSNITIPVFGEIKIKIDGGSGGGSGKPSHHNPDTLRDILRKQGSQEEGKEGELNWYLHINRNNAVNMFKTDFTPVVSSNDIIVIDDLEDITVKDDKGQDVDSSKYKIELIQDSFRIYLDMLIPATDNTDVISWSSVYWPNVYRITNDNNYINFDKKIANGDKEGWKKFKESVEKADKPTVGIYNNEKIIINFKKIPYSDKTYSGLYGGSEKLKTLIDNRLNENWINKDQADKMKAAYTKLPILHFSVNFKTKVEGLKVNYKVKNKASVGVEDFGGEATVKYASSLGGAVTKADYIHIEAEKEWKDHKGRTVEPNVDKIKIIVSNDVGEQEKIFYLKKDDGWRGKLEEKLPSRKRVNGVVKNIKYTLKEEKISGYTMKPVADPEYNESTATDHYKITNVKDKTTIDIPVEKMWKEVPEGEALPSAVKVKLLADGAEVSEKSPLILKESNSWKGVFEDLPIKNTTNGENINYTLEEEPVAGFKGVIERKDQNDIEKGFTITNTKAKINIPVEKKWDGFKVGEGPADVAEVEVELFANGTATNKKLKLNKDNSWKDTFKDLEINENGIPIEYTVKEKPIEGWYLSEQTGDAEHGFVLTNKKNPKIEIEVTKKWLRKDGTTELPKKHKKIPASIKVQLVNVTDNEDVGNEQEITAAKDWKHTFKNLPKFNATGTEIKYAVKEIGAPEGFASTVGEVTGGKAVIKNTLAENPVTIKIKKEWKDENGADLTDDLKTRVVMQILHRLADGTYKLDEPVIEMSKDKGWSYTSNPLPEVDENGNKINYQVQEIEVPEGYRATSDVSADGLTFTITNTKIPRKSIKIEKKWVDENNNPLAADYEKMPNEITVRLYANGVSYKTVTLKKDADWKGQFDNLLTVDPSGDPIRYDVEELGFVDGFVPYKKVDQAKDIITITNKKTEEIVQLNISKKWVDVNNNPITDSNRLPDHISFKLFANGVSKGKLYVSKASGWNYTSGPLAKLDNKGKVINYTIEEDYVGGYTSTISKGADGYTFTATNKENPTPPGNPFIPPFIPDEPVPTPPNIPTPPAPNVPIDELVIEDDEVVLAGNDEEDLDDPEITDEPEDEEITDDLPRSNKDVPKTADFFMSGFANPLAVSTVIMMGYGLKKLVAKKKKD